MRKSCNTILGIERTDGSWTEDIEEVENIFIDYFQNMFSTSSPPLWTSRQLQTLFLILPPEVNARILAHFGKEEVEVAVKQMFPTKSPGPNGFPPLFYQK